MTTHGSLAIGFDAMCLDITIHGLARYFQTIKFTWPQLKPLIEALEHGRDEEFTAGALGMSSSEFFQILEWLKRCHEVMVECHLGANTALEVLTASHLRMTPVDYLGLWSPQVLEQVPEHEKILAQALTHALEVEGMAVSIIIPHEGKRAILSFGGAPPLRTMSPALRNYLKRNVQAYLEQQRPKILILVGTHVTFGAARGQDFALLGRLVTQAKSVGTKVVMDMGGLGSWDDDRFEAYFRICRMVDMLAMNEGELTDYYRYCTDSLARGTNLAGCQVMMQAVEQPGQQLLLHTPEFSLAYGFDPSVNHLVTESLSFANQTAAWRAEVGRFPCRDDMYRAQMPYRDMGGMGTTIPGLPAGLVGAAGFLVEVKNSVGLGDTWTQAFVQMMHEKGVF